MHKASSPRALLNLTSDGKKDEVFILKSGPPNIFHVATPLLHMTGKALHLMG